MRLRARSSRSRYLELAAFNFCARMHIRGKWILIFKLYLARVILMSQLYFSNFWRRGALEPVRKQVVGLLRRVWRTTNVQLSVIVWNRDNMLVLAAQCISDGSTRRACP